MFSVSLLFSLYYDIFTKFRLFGCSTYTWYALMFFILLKHAIKLVFENMRLKKCFWDWFSTKLKSPL